MKKLISLPISLLMLGCIFAVSCQNKETLILSNSPWVTKKSCSMPFIIGTKVIATGVPNQVCVIGNEESNSTCCTYQIENADINDWEAISNLKQPRSNHDAVAVSYKQNNNIVRKIFVMAGSYQGNPVNTIERLTLNNSNSQWETINTTFSPQNMDIAIAVYQTSQPKLICIQGQMVRSFSPISEQWEATSFPKVPELLYHNQAVIVGDMLYYLGSTSIKGERIKMYQLNLNTLTWNKGETVEVEGERVLKAKSFFYTQFHDAPTLVITGEATNDFLFYYDLTTQKFAVQNKIFGIQAPLNTSNYYGVAPASTFQNLSFVLIGEENHQQKTYLYVGS